MNEEIKAKELIKKYYPTSKGVNSGFLVSNEDIYIQSAKKNAILECQSIIDELELIVSESTHVHQSFDTPKKLCIDILNPHITFYKGVITAIEQQ